MHYTVPRSKPSSRLPLNTIVMAKEKSEKKEKKEKKKEVAEPVAEVTEDVEMGDAESGKVR